MTYPKITIPNLQADEQGYQLDIGDLVAVSLKPLRDAGPAQVGFIVCGRWVDATGAAMNDIDGKPLEWEHSFAAHQVELANGTTTAAQLMATAIQACLDGDPSPAGTNTNTDHPDGGIKSKIMAAKLMLAAMPMPAS